MLKVFSNFDLPSYHRDALLLLCGNAGPTGYFKIKWGQKYLLRAICPDLWFKTGECIYRNWVGTIPQCLHLYVPSGLQWRFALHLEFLANPPPPPTRPATTSLMMAESYFKSANLQIDTEKYFSILDINSMSKKTTINLPIKLWHRQIWDVSTYVLIKHKN